MELHYLAYCRPDTPFYDAPPPLVDDVVEALGPVPDGWVTRSNSEWFFCEPVGHVLPVQGWKIHVSTTMDTVDTVLSTVADYCFAATLPFKVLRSRAVLGRRNSKYGDRGSSGKFIAIFPADDDELSRALLGLDPLVAGLPGPSILSDLRFRSGPLYVRYGAFVLRYGRTESGRQVPCLETPDGDLVPDERKPGFHVPPWVTLPAVLEESLEARSRGTLEGFPYQVQGALHFSNGGGVYRAVHRNDGAEVLLKEARPHAGLDEQGVDAVQRLRNEHEALVRLDGVPGVPVARELRRGYEHWFHARDFLPGVPLTAYIHRLNPAIPGGDSLDPAEYVAWASRILARVEDGIRAMHARGVVFADLHPNNVIVGPGDEVGFIDFESASRVDEPSPQTIGAPGFRAPVHLAGVDVDLWALACLRLAVFLPLTEVLPWSPGKLDQFVAWIRGRFPVDDAWERSVRAVLGRGWAAPVGAVDLDGRAAPEAVDEAMVRRAATAPPAPAWATAQEWAQSRLDTAAAIIATATTDRSDRLYPGDIAAFLSPGAGLAFAAGAAGVLWTLAVGGIEVPPEHRSWFVDAVRRDDALGAGLLDGTAGIALALDRLGLTEPALEQLARALEVPRDVLDHSVWRGTAGVGLAALDLARHDPGLLARAVELAEETSARAGSGAVAGLLHGGAGAALFLAEVGQRTGDHRWFDRARAALDADLALLGWSPEGVPLGSGWGNPVLAAGSTGCALAARALAAHDDDPRLRAVLAGVRGVEGTCAVDFLPFGGMVRGRAGVVLTLAGAWRGEDMPADVAVLVDRHVGSLDLVAVPTVHGHLALGDNNLKLSCDWATGAAGVLHALDVRHGRHDLLLPGLTFPARPRDRGTVP